MVWLTDTEKNLKTCLFVSTVRERDRQTEGRTDRYRITVQAALMHSIARQKSPFSTNILLYLGNGTRYGHSYYGLRIGSKS